MSETSLLHAGYSLLDGGYSMLDTRCSMLDTRCSMYDIQIFELNCADRYLKLKDKELYRNLGERLDKLGRKLNLFIKSVAKNHKSVK